MAINVHLLLFLLKEVNVWKNIDSSITSGIEKVFRNYEDVLRLRDLIFQSIQR